jgi:hypothetical protein
MYNIQGLCISDTGCSNYHNEDVTKATHKYAQQNSDQKKRMYQYSAKVPVDGDSVQFVGRMNAILGEENWKEEGEVEHHNQNEEGQTLVRHRQDGLLEKEAQILRRRLDPSATNHSPQELDLIAEHIHRRLSHWVFHGGRHTIGGPKACIDSAAASHFFNRPSVRKALHVTMKNGHCWSTCSQQAGWHYTKTASNLPRDVYPYLLSKIRVLIFNGDVDACVPYTDNYGWTKSMGFPIKHHWRPWHYKPEGIKTSQVGGYAIDYDVSKLGGKGFTFATVRGAGHEVPRWQPEMAYELLTKFLKNEEM